MYKGMYTRVLALTVLGSVLAAPANATDSRVTALSGNVGITDDTDFTRFASETGQMGDHAWLNYDGLTLGGAMSWGSNAVMLNQGANGAAIGYYNSSGDTGYNASFAYDGNTEGMTFGGGYAMADRSDGLGNMAFGGQVMLVDDSLGIMANAISRTLTDDSVTSWGGSAAYSDAGIGLGGGYQWYGARFGDASAITMGSGLGVDLPDGGDMAIGLNLLDVNLAGEFMFNDWFGLRGSVTTSMVLDNLTDEMELGVNMGSGFGASLVSEAGVIDLVIDPSQVLGGPFFLTGNTAGPAIALSARFSI